MIKFYFKETLRLISGSKSFFLLSLLSMIISLLLISLLLITMDFSSAVETKLKNEFALNVFIQDSVDEETISVISSVLQSENSIREVTYIGKEKAAEIFSSETGEDIKGILDFNPLPASFLVKIKDQFINPDAIEKLIFRLSALEGVDEIVHKQDHLKKVVDYINAIKKYLTGVAAILFILTIAIVYSTSKMLFISRKDDIETMKMVGAKISAIKLPVFFYSAIIGLVAGLISLSISNLYLSELYRYISILENSKLNNVTNILTFLSVGPAIAVVVSYFTMRKITLKF